MKFQTLLISLVCIAFTSCSSDDISVDSFRDDTSIESLNGTWRVVSFEDFTTGTVEEKSEQNSWNLDIIVTFDDKQLPASVSGKNTTNTIHGQFAYVGQRGLQVSNLMSTYINQPPWANQFNAAILDGDVSFGINNTQLRIYYANKTKSVTFARN
jgi:hypothetical protein